jgi:hypothetical protein
MMKGTRYRAPATIANASKISPTWAMYFFMMAGYRDVLKMLANKGSDRNFGLLPLL